MEPEIKKQRTKELIESSLYSGLGTGILWNFGVFGTSSEVVFVAFLVGTAIANAIIAFTKSDKQI